MYLIARHPIDPRRDRWSESQPVIGLRRRSVRDKADE
jgi:hypothetical protein